MGFYNSDFTDNVEIQKMQSYDINQITNEELMDQQKLKNSQDSFLDISEIQEMNNSNNEFKKKFPTAIEIDEQKALSQYKIQLEDTEVYFPYNPYPIQQNYMATLIKALNNQQNALLQSPTGTGKTLNLLCASLAWLQKKRAEQLKNNEKIVLNKIIYTSRTHSQLKQALGELKKTVYRPKTCLLGSRDQYCVLPSIQMHKGLLINSQCKNACFKHTCPYYENIRSNSTYKKHISNIQDIEELKSSAVSQTFCPYLYTRNIKDDSDIIFLPYSYVLDVKKFGSFDIDLENAIVIFDEAHNIAKVSEEGSSISISLDILQQAEEEMQKIQKTDKNVQLIKEFLGPIQSFKKYMQSLVKDKSQKMQYQNGERGFSCPGRDIFNLFSENTQCQLPNLHSNNDHTNSRSQTQNRRQRKTDESDTTTRQHSSNQASLEKYGFFKKKDSIEQPSQQQQVLNQESVNNQQQNNNNNAEKNQNFLMQKFQQQTKQLDSLQTPDKEDLQFQIKKQKQLQIPLYNRDQYQQGINLKNFQRYLNIAQQILGLLTIEKNYGVDNWLIFINGLNELWQIDEKYQGNQQISENLINHYYIIAKIEEDTVNYQGRRIQQKNCIINLACFDPSISINKIVLENAYNIVLTSGTLSPFKAWERELKIPFTISISTGHIVNVKENVLAGIVSKGYQSCYLNFSFKNRQNQQIIEQIYQETGQLIIRLAEQIPHGILIIFGSYKILNDCQQSWEQSAYKLWQRLNQIKPVRIEPRSAVEAEECIRYYCKAAKTEKGAILMAVCKGKLTEGIDFNDELARAVFLIGVPYPPFMDRQIILKKQYLDKAKYLFQGEKGISGEEWYLQETVRQMNQSIGRVIRHINDFGAIYLCDQRFQNKELKDQISGWIKGENDSNLKIWESVANTLVDTTNFFNKHQQKATDLQQVLKQGTEIFEQQEKIQIKKMEFQKQKTKNTSFNQYQIAEKHVKDMQSLIQEDSNQFLYDLPLLYDQDPIDNQDNKQNDLLNQNLENYVINQEPQFQQMQQQQQQQIKGDQINNQFLQIELNEKQNQENINDDQIINNNNNIGLKNKDVPVSKKLLKMIDSNFIQKPNNQLTKLQLLSKQSSQQQQPQVSKKRFITINQIDNLNQNQEQMTNIQSDVIQQQENIQNFENNDQFNSSRHKIRFNTRLLGNSKKSLQFNQINNANNNKIDQFKNNQNDIDYQTNNNSFQIQNQYQGQGQLQNYQQNNQFNSPQYNQIEEESNIDLNDYDCDNMKQNNQNVEQEADQQQQEENVNKSQYQFNRANSDNIIMSSVQQQNSDNQDESNIMLKSDNQQQNRSPYNQFNNDNENSNGICCICYQKSNSLYVSSHCNHAACYICWENWLKYKLNCPLCRERVRLKYLTKLENQQ